MSSNVARWRASHVPGRWPVLMGPSSLVVVDPSITADLTDVWEKVVASASMAELVTALAAIGPDQSPDLVALFWSPAGLRSLVRGDARLFDPATAEVVADGAGMLTWREVELAGHQQLEIDLGAGPVGSRGLPLAVGAVRAGAIRIEAGDGAAVISPQALLAEEMPYDDPLESSEADPIAAGAMWPPIDRPPVAVSARSASSPGGPGSIEPPVPAATEIWVPEDDDAPVDFGGLTQRTSPPTVEESLDEGRFEMENGDTELMPIPVDQPAPDESPAATEAVDGAPLVQAAICVSGHPNPPHAQRCGLCGAAVPPQTTQPVPRPALGVLRSPDGSSLPIDRPILVGRAPVLRDDLAEVPELMRVPSPGQDISRTHLLVTPDEWEIRLTDLHSTNGTAVVRPGPNADRVDLRPGEPLAVTVGTVVELGDGVTVLVDAPPAPGT